MNADNTAAQNGETGESLSVTEVEGQPAGPRHSLLDVLMPANPPQPTNARVIRLFDCDGAKDDARPAANTAGTRASTPREAAKAARKLSLFAAAGLE